MHFIGKLPWAKDAEDYLQGGGRKGRALNMLYTDRAIFHRELIQLFDEMLLAAFIACMYIVSCLVNYKV